MGRIKVFIYLALFLVTSNAIAQIDTVTFSFVPDVATYRIRCQAQKVNVVSGDTTFTDFQIEDTAAYTFDWGGTKNPNIDGIPLVTYEFDGPGVYSFTLSVYEDVSGKTFIETKSFEIRDLIRVPNVFTPNDDGINELFIVNSNGITPLEITIFSRTGTMVYQQRAPIIVWDGRNSSGSELSDGVYFYILKSDDPNIPVQKGFIHLYGLKPKRLF